MHSTEENAPTRTSDICRLWEVHVVNRLHDELSGDALAPEETAVQAFDGVLTTLELVKFDVDLSVGGARSDGNVNNFAVLVVAFVSNVFFELLIPAGCLSTKKGSA